VALLRSLLRSVHHAPDRILHGRRRIAALRRLRAGPPPARVLFVCYGNICRSPYAEYRLRRDLHARGIDTITTASAGLLGEDRACPPELRELAMERGLDLKPHRSRLVTPEMLAGHDLVIAMEPAQVRRLQAMAGAEGPALLLALGDLDPGPIDTRGIIDPWGHSRQVYASVLDRLDTAIASLGQALVVR
jgi:protein-tyrosine phosphatase